MVQCYSAVHIITHLQSIVHMHMTLIQHKMCRCFVQREICVAATKEMSPSPRSPVPTSKRFLLGILLIIFLCPYTYTMSTLRRHQQICYINEMETTYSHDGCTSVTTIPVCRGVCLSQNYISMVSSPRHPILHAECTCCSATRYFYQRRRLTFVCHNEKLNTTTTKIKKFWFPNIEECGCINCLTF